MAQRVARNLKESGQLQNYRVNVRYENGIAWLSGTVTSGHQAQKAIDVTLATQGVEQVMNYLEIVPPEGPIGRSSDLRLASGPTPAAASMLRAEPAGPSAARGMPRPMGPAGVQQAGHRAKMNAAFATPGGYIPSGGAQSVSYDHASMPGYAWPSTAAHPNYAAVSYPRQYSPAAWPYIGPFYPYPQVPLGWRKVTLEWDDGWWFLDFTE